MNSNRAFSTFDSKPLQISGFRPLKFALTIFLSKKPKNSELYEFSYELKHRNYRKPWRISFENLKKTLTFQLFLSKNPPISS